MKKTVSLLLVLAMVMDLAVSAMAQTTQEAALEDAANLSWDELVEKAKAEIGSDPLLVYGTISEPADLTADFLAKTGITITWEKYGDSELYTKLDAELAGSGASADLIIAQDSYSLATTLIDNGYALNYFPAAYADVVDESSREPLALLYLAKFFMYNNTDGRTGYLHNVWQLAGSSADAEHISGTVFKPATTETVNMNFLVMLTSDEWCTKLAEAYKDYYGTEYVDDGSYKNIGYKWIAEFLSDTVAASSETDAAKGAAASAQAGVTCFVPMSKFRNLKADAGVGNESAANLTVAALEDLEGFGGFLYAQYLQVLSNAVHPYTAALFINYLLSEDGYALGWGKTVGYYSSNNNATYDASNNNQPLSVWREKCVVEDKDVLTANYSDVYKFVLAHEG